MLERRSLGEISHRPHSMYRSKKTNENVFEFVLTRDGFSGGFTLLYQEHAPTSVKLQHGVSSIDKNTFLGEFVPLESQELARRHIQTWQANDSHDFYKSRTALFRNPNCRVSVVRLDKPQNMDVAFVNGDGDELYFVFSGEAKLLTPFGRLDVHKHDYVLIPRGTPYAWIFDKQFESLVIEGDPVMAIPNEYINPHGQLKLEAPYNHRDFRSPTTLLSKDEQAIFLKTYVLKNNTFTEHDYNYSLGCVLGWDGSVYPMAFSIYDYIPKTGRIHLPPNLHMTFKGQKAVICSFVPRMVDYGEGAIPCPYPHANVHCDEIIYYVSGNFTSRAGIKERSISWHPAGMPHGPQPGKYFGSVGHKQTDEVAVMLDIWDPLQISKKALAIEDASYKLSWQEG